MGGVRQTAEKASTFELQQGTFVWQLARMQKISQEFLSVFGARNAGRDFRYAVQRREAKSMGQQLSFEGY